MEGKPIKEDAQKEYKYKIASLEKAFNIIELLAVSKREMSVAEICRLTDQQAGTVYRFLSTMRGIGYIEQNKRTKKYFLTYNFVKISNHIMNRNGWMAKIYPYINLIIHKYNFGVVITGFTATQVVMLKNFSFVNPIEREELGNVLPLHCSAAGKIFLTRLAEPELSKVLDEISYIPHASKTILSKELLRQDVEITRERGYSTCVDEYEQGHAILGVPLRNSHNEIVGTINFTTTTDRLHQLINESTIFDIMNIIKNAPII